VALRGYGLTKATALTKLFNWTSNVAACCCSRSAAGAVAAGAQHGGGRDGRRLARQPHGHAFGARLIRPLLVTAAWR
jgi:hypothetical protein